MWRKDGSKLSGNYGTWRGREVELNAQGPDRGKWKMIQDGGDSPGPEWSRKVRPNRFARTPFRYWLDVDESEVTDVHVFKVFGVIDGVKACLVAEDVDGLLALESDVHTPPNFRDNLAKKYQLEYYELAFVYGWVPSEDVHDIFTERRDV